MSADSTPWLVGLAVAELGISLGFAVVAALPIRGYAMLTGAVLLLPLSPVDRRN